MQRSPVDLLLSLVEDEADSEDTFLFLLILFIFLGESILRFLIANLLELDHKFLDNEFLEIFTIKWKCYKSILLLEEFLVQCLCK